MTKIDCLVYCAHGNRVGETISVSTCQGFHSRTCSATVVYGTHGHKRENKNKVKIMKKHNKISSGHFRKTLTRTAGGGQRKGPLFLLLVERGEEAV